MTDIKRYVPANDDRGEGTVVRNDQSGTVVFYDDHAAIVVELQEQVRAWESENAAMRSAINQTIGWQESVDPSNRESVRILVGLITPNTDAAIREILAQGVEGFVEFNRKLAKDYPMAMVAKALEVTELNGEQYAARIRAGEQP